MKQEARLKRNERIYNWVAQGMNAQEITRLLGKRYKLSATQVRKIIEKKLKEYENTK